jgi:hypothetical protein
MAKAAARAKSSVRSGKPAGPMAAAMLLPSLSITTVAKRKCLKNSTVP